jgi:hypothetical protein
MPTMDDVDVFPREAAAVAMKAIEQGIAQITNVTFEQEYARAKKLILRARGMVHDAMAMGYIALPEGSAAPKPSKMVMAAVAKATAKPKAKQSAKQTKKTARRTLRSGKKRTR